MAISALTGDVSKTSNNIRSAATTSSSVLLIAAAAASSGFIAGSGLPKFERRLSCNIELFYGTDSF
ncbi:hypothetical protein [Cryobacterium sp. Hz9]|uniref:hypothetical protein n=1 Tax=Cryobacterium sp. Hz9 TaxID=1259167 RepID=UPI00106B0DE6|nr:hypothetical protein [Cryobacterium sp. Hz9]TFB66848.1 hypothetical protein E3N85_09760 [Cryobacterium sp. Hz9]